MDQVARLPLLDLYHDHKKTEEPFISDKVKEEEVVVGRKVRHKRSFSSDVIYVPPGLWEWAVCSGGLITLVIAMLFTYHTI